MIGEVVIGRIDAAPTRVAHARANDGWMTPEPGVRTPESTKPEGGGLYGDGGVVERQHHAEHTP